MRGSVIKRGKGYSVVYRASDPETGRTKQVWKGGYKTKGEAETALKDIVHAVDEGTYVRPIKQTLSQFITDDWLPSLDAQVTGGAMKPTTRSFYANLARRHVVPRIGGTMLTAVSAPHLNKLYGALLAGRGPGGRPLSPTTVHAVHVTISRALGDAVRWRKLSHNVAANADPPSPSRVERPVWSADQLRAFLASVRDDRLAALWTLAMTTGLRRAELAGIRWADVNLEAGRLRVAQTRVTDGYKVVVSTPKTAKSARTIGLDAATVTGLRAHLHRQRQEQLAWGPGSTDTGLVFVRDDGTGYHPQRLAQMFKVKVTAAKLPPLGLHGLRHSYATAALESGVDHKTISIRLGHSSIAITGDLYAHTLAHVDQAAADRTASFILGARHA